MFDYSPEIVKSSSLQDMIFFFLGFDAEECFDMNDEIVERILKATVA